MWGRGGRRDRGWEPFSGSRGWRERSARARAGPAVAAVTVLRVHGSRPAPVPAAPSPAARARGVFLAPPRLPPPSPRLLLSQSWVSLALLPPLPLRSA